MTCRLPTLPGGSTSRPAIVRRAPVPDRAEVDVRAGGADRAAVGETLGRALLSGHLDLAEYKARLEQMFTVTTQRELAGLTGDLPRTVLDAPVDQARRGRLARLTVVVHHFGLIQRRVQHHELIATEAADQAAVPGALHQPGGHLDQELAWQTIRETGAIEADTDAEPVPFWRVIRTAVLINLLNPKLTIFSSRSCPSSCLREPRTAPGT